MPSGRNVIDNFNQETSGVEIDFSLRSLRIIRALEQIMEWRGCPAVIRCDNGPYVERFNRTVRYEWLSRYYWEDLDEVRLLATPWMDHYNHHHPHMALGGFTPKERLAMAA